MPPNRHRFAPAPGDSFFALLYRFFFFDWLFADLAAAGELFERHAIRRHNRAMRRYLPVYLRRWGILAGAAFLSGSLCDKVFEAQVAATCCFTGFGVTLGVMAVLVANWVLLADSRPS